METSNASPATLEVRAAAAGRGADWIAEGYELFRQKPGVWIGILLIWMVLSSVIAGIGLGVVGPFINPIFTAGMMLGCASLARGEGLRVEHLFAGFRSGRIGPLLMLTVWTTLLALAGLVVLVLPVFLPLALSVDFDGLASAEDLLKALGMVQLLLLVLAVLMLGLLLAMATWFAPPLIVFRGVAALEAMKLSFRGCVRNWLALSVYGLLALVMLIVAAIPLLLGLLIAIPVLMASIYTSYRDIYPE